jgi:hypothetical protein
MVDLEWKRGEENKEGNRGPVRPPAQAQWKKIGMLGLGFNTNRYNKKKTNKKDQAAIRSSVGKAPELGSKPAPGYSRKKEETKGDPSVWWGPRTCTVALASTVGDDCRCTGQAAVVTRTETSATQVGKGEGTG